MPNQEDIQIVFERWYADHIALPGGSKAGELERIETQWSACPDNFTRLLANTYLELLGLHGRQLNIVRTVTFQSTNSGRLELVLLHPHKR